jgi:hypothetical protein
VPARRIVPEEFQRVYGHAGELGFKRLFVQFPGGHKGSRPSRSRFLPDFREAEPFGKKGPENIE